MRPDATVRRMMLRPDNEGSGSSRRDNVGTCPKNFGNELSPHS